MSKSEELLDISSKILREHADDAVFTVNQTKEILRLDKIFTDYIIDYIEKIPKDNILCEIIKLIEYDEHNTEIVSSMKSDIEHIDKELTCTQHELYELSEKTSLALLSQAKELQNVENSIKLLELKDYKDNRVDKIMDSLSNYSTKKDIEKLESSLSLFTKSIKALECKLEKMEQVNNAQSIKINELNEEIACLNRKLDRNTIALDNKIDNLEKRETVDAKVDSNQNATLAFLQGEIVKLNNQIERMQKTFLLKPCV